MPAGWHLLGAGLRGQAVAASSLSTVACAALLVTWELHFKALLPNHKNYTSAFFFLSLAYFSFFNSSTDSQALLQL